MKFETYEEYIKHATEYYSDKELTIPIEYMLLDEEMFNLFNGSISFGVGEDTCQTKCEDCTCEKSDKKDGET